MLWDMAQKIVRHVAQCGARTRFAPLSYSDDMVNSSGGDCRGERGKERILYDIRREKFNAVKSFGLANPEQADAKVEPFRVEWTWPQSRCEASECVLLGHTSSLLCRRPTEVLDLIVGSPGKCEPRLGGCTLLPHTCGQGWFQPIRSDQDGPSRNDPSDSSGLFRVRVCGKWCCSNGVDGPFCCWIFSDLSCLKHVP